MVQGTGLCGGQEHPRDRAVPAVQAGGVSRGTVQAQNMALNSFATPDGREIGRSQAVQAAAAGVAPAVEMNPILLKPEAGGRSQVVLLGRPVSNENPASIARRYAERWDHRHPQSRYIAGQLRCCRHRGAGSPAEGQSAGGATS